MSDEIQAHDESGRSSSGLQSLLIVGIGASAGGISALKQFFSHVSPNSGMAFVVIQHLSPQHESNLAAVLQTQVKVPVTQVNETLEMKPDHVYVVPPNKYLVIEDGEIKLTEPERPRGAHTSIDLFFRTLAEAYGKNAVGIVMSGAGTDGTLGLGRIKECGGYGIVQDPAEAEYDAMPRSAIDKGMYDLILPAAEMPDRLRALRERATRLSPTSTEDEEKPLPDEDLAEVHEILAMLRQRTGHDFSQYKRPTLLRRIGRRVHVHGFTDMASYVIFLRQHSEEIPALLRELLITVTNFFRDHEAFEVLEREVVPKLFAGKTVNDWVRIWVVGCATGEEAYSIAMLLCEYAQQLANPPKIQIFATDISERAITEARRCHYPRSIAVDVSAARLRQFFIQDNDHYQVKKEIRELILFAPHNVLRDPPFSNLDLVSCRNLLIYLTHESQERVLGTLHFALAPKGYLFLGASESAGESPLFIPFADKQRIYSRRAVAASMRTTLGPANEWNIRSPESIDSAAGKVSSYGEMHHRAVEQLAPPSVLVNEDYDIVHLSEHAGRYLRFAGGIPSRNLLNAVHPEVRLELRAMLLAAKARSDEASAAAETRRLRLKIDGKPAFSV